MKRLAYTFTLLVVGIFLPVTAKADDADDVKSAVEAFYDALNSGDAAGVSKFTSPGSTFPRHGRLLRSQGNTTQESRKARLQASFDAGLNYDLRIHHLDVKVHGETSVATYYTTGPTTYSNGTLLQGTFRASLIWLKQGSQWRIVHIHISRLET